MENNKIVSFQLLRIEKNHRKVCTCDPPQYEINITNRIVVCQKCGAVVDSFEALSRLGEHIEKLEEYQRVAKESSEKWLKIADKEYRRRMKYRAFREMDKEYQNNMLPICPRCNKAFEPMEISRYVSRKYANLGESEGI